MVSRIVCWRAGRSRGPRSRTSSRRSNRASSASGREEADARGGQLDGQRQAVQPRADLGHCRGIVGRDLEPGLDRLGAADEEANRLRAPDLLDRGRCVFGTGQLTRSRGGIFGSARGGSGSSCSPRRLNRSRLVTTTRRRGQRVRRSATNGAALITCSKLSRTSRRWRSRRCSKTRSRGDSPLVSPRSSAEAMATGTRIGIGHVGERNERRAIGELRTQLGGEMQREPRLAGASRSGQRQQSRGLMILTCRLSSGATKVPRGRGPVAISRSRPMRGVAGCGTLWRKRCGVRSGGKSAGSPGATT